MSALIVCMQTMQNTQGLEWKDRMEVLAPPCSSCVLLRESWTFLSSDLPSENWESKFSLLWVVLQIKWDDVLRKSSENLKALNRSFIHICYHCSLSFFFLVFCIKTSCQMWEQNHNKTQAESKLTNNKSNCNSRGTMNYLLCPFPCFE